MTVQEKKYYTYGGIAILLIGGYYMFKGSNGSGDGVDPTGNGGTTTPYVFNAQKVANELFNAMRYSGTDEELIIESLSKVTKAQFALVFKAFGKHEYNVDLGNQNSFVWETLPKEDLKKWLFEELSDTDYKILKLKYPNYL
jgi:hypothetical protein